MFCDRCGAEVSRKAAACPECGHRPAPYRALPPAEALENLRKQWVAYSRIRLYGGLLVTLQMLGWLRLLERELEPLRSGADLRGLHHPGPQSVALAIVFFVGILGIVWAMVGFAGTRGLEEESPAGRARASFMATLLLLDVPFGTVLAIVLLRAIARVDESERTRPPAKGQ